MDTSNEATPGPRRTLRPALPNVYRAGTANAAVLNHSLADRLESVGVPTTFGRSEPKFPPVFPVLLLSNWRTGVNGWPDCAVKIAALSRFRKTTLWNGNKYMYASTARCGVSKLDKACS